MARPFSYDPQQAEQIEPGFHLGLEKPAIDPIDIITGMMGGYLAKPAVAAAEGPAEDILQSTLKNLIKSGKVSELRPGPSESDLMKFLHGENFADLMTSWQSNPIYRFMGPDDPMPAQMADKTAWWANELRQRGFNKLAREFDAHQMDWALNSAKNWTREQIGRSGNWYSNLMQSNSDLVERAEDLLYPSGGRSPLRVVK
jgi:hypothetical protein